MNKINILYMTCFGTFKGGGQRSLYLLIKHLDKEKFCPSLVVPEAGSVKDEIEALGIKVFVVPPARLRSLDIGGIRRTLRALTRIVEETGAHLISTDSVRETFYARWAGRSRRVPVLLHLRVTDSPAWVDRVLYPFVDRMIAVSHAAAGRFRMMDRKGKVRVVYNGADLQSLQPAPARTPDGRLRIGYFGRLQERKGVDTLIKAVRRLDGMPLSVHIFGEGDEVYARYLKEMASGDDRIIFEGFVEDVPQRIRRLDAVVLASRRTEGLSRALIEAMALGRPVIVSDVPSNPELVGEAGRSFIFRRDDEADLARLLKELCEQPGRLRDAGPQARRRAEELFDLKKNTRQMEDIYRQTARPDVKARKILIVNLGGIGDLLLSSAALRMMREHFRDASIVFCGVSRVAAYARSLGLFDEVVSLPGYELEARRFLMSQRWSIFLLLMYLRRKRFDLAVNMRTLHSWPGAWKMAFLFFSIGARVRAGRDTDHRGFFFHIKIPERTQGEKHEMEYDVDMVRALGVPVSDRHLCMAIPETARKTVTDLLENQGVTSSDCLIGVNPGGMLSRRWPLDYFSDALRKILEGRPGVVVITGTKGEQGLGEALAGALRGRRVINTAGSLSWAELGALVNRCDLFISNDTGPMHLAAALRTPLVAIFGPGCLTRFDPRPLSDKAIVLYEKAVCAPCEKFSCRDLRCLKRISPQAVAAAGLELLGRQGR